MYARDYNANVVGASLRYRLACEKFVPKSALHTSGQIARALELAHHCCVVYQDSVKVSKFSWVGSCLRPSSNPLSSAHLFLIDSESLELRWDARVRLVERCYR
jgi:hypothetical protein